MKGNEMERVKCFPGILAAVHRTRLQVVLLTMILILSVIMICRIVSSITRIREQHL